MSSPSQPPAGAVSRESVATAEALFHGPQYRRHNARRQEHLASLGLDLRGKSVLELGAGVGDHTTFFLDRDCTVTSVEPRIENCIIFGATMQSLRSAGYSKAANARLIQADIESVAEKITQRFDVVYSYGLLYHLSDPQRGLETMAAYCNDLLLLETCVAFGAHEDINPLPEPQVDPTQAFGGQGCRPGRSWIFARLKALFAHVYVPRTQPAHEEFPLDWTATRAQSLTRAIFIAARRPLANPQLLDHLPDRQIAI
jgi:SAM-dependent methyltransferase